MKKPKSGKTKDLVFREADDQAIYSTGRIAKLLGCSSRTVNSWFDEGILHGYRLPKSQDRRIPRTCLEKFLRDNNMFMPEHIFKPYRVLGFRVPFDLQVWLVERDPLICYHFVQNWFAFGIDYPRILPQIVIMDTLSDTDSAFECSQRMREEKVKTLAILADDRHDDGTRSLFDVCLYEPLEFESIQQNIHRFFIHPKK